MLGRPLLLRMARNRAIVVQPEMRQAEIRDATIEGGSVEIERVIDLSCCAGTDVALAGMTAAMYWAQV